MGGARAHPCLHFEVCYYQAIEYAILHGLSRVEAGAQGEHKLARGYLPATTYSCTGSPTRLRRAIDKYLEQERQAVEEEITGLMQYSPFRKENEQ